MDVEGMTDDVVDPEVERRARRALAPFGFFDSVRAEMMGYYAEAPDGVDQVIADVLALAETRPNAIKTKPAGLIVARCKRGDHLRAQREDPRPRVTGWRVVYGDGHASLSYVEDPAGTDPLPEGYDLLTRSPYVAGEWRGAEAEVEAQARRTREAIADEAAREVSDSADRAEVLRALRARRSETEPT